MHDVAHPFDERFCSHLVDVLFEAGIIIKRAADDGSSNRHRWIRAEPANEGCFQLEIVFRGISLEEHRFDHIVPFHRVHVVRHAELALS